MKTIGFAEKFYTLWDVTKEDVFSTTISANGENHRKSGERVICTYIKNISYDLGKVQELYPDTPINEDLRGMSRSFEYLTGEAKIQYADDVFSIGYNKGCAIALCNSIRDLKWAFDNESGNVRINNIKNKMISLGMVEAYGVMYDNQEQADKAIELINNRAAAQLNTDNILDAMTNGGVLDVTFEKNLDSYGCYYDRVNGVTIQFENYKIMSYNGFEYALPSVNGKGKKVKGQTLSLTCKTIRDIQNGSKVLLVTNF